MKKVVLSALLLLICTLFFACGGKNEKKTDTPAETTEALTTEAVTTVKTPVLTLRVGTYNIKHTGDTNLIVKPFVLDIKGKDLDIISFQEVDQMTKRVNKMNTLQQIADGLGYKYWKFAKAIDYQGGEYGTGIVSRYPIESFEVTPLESGTYEKRSIGHAVINVNGVLIDYFNTHLSFEDQGVRTTQFKAVNEMTSKCETFILTADFNTPTLAEFYAIKNSIRANDGKYGTYKGSNTPIDDIILSKDFKILETGMLENDHSDHNMLWAKVELYK